jgi:hypothetical protein
VELIGFQGDIVIGSDVAPFHVVSAFQHTDIMAMHVRITLLPVLIDLLLN